MGIISGLESQDPSDSQSCACPGREHEHALLSVRSWNLTEGHINNTEAYIWQENAYSV